MKNSKEVNVMYKKAIALILALLLCATFVGCGESNNIDEEKPQNNTSSIESDSLNSNSEAASSTVSNNAKYCARCNKFPVSLDKQYCDSCLCYDPSCSNLNESMSFYCQQHKCLMCNDSKEWSSPYCHKHKCDKSNCSQAALDGEKYCYSHLN